MQSENWLWLNGTEIPVDQARISPLDRGFMLGDGLFETVRARHGIAEAFDAHWERLANSALRVRIPLPWSKEQIAEAIKSLCARNGLTDATVRLTLTRGLWKGGLGIDPNEPPTLLILALPIHHVRESYYTDGVDVWISTICKGTPGSESDLKATHYLSNVLAKAQADDNGCYEAIIQGVGGRILECSTASFFCVLDGMLCTPPLDGTILPGITRHILLKLAKECGMDVRERHVFLSEIPRMQEAFLSSSVRGPMPIRRLSDAVLPASPGPLTLRLRSEWDLATARLSTV